jgi:glycosyltransferase involved in cell wall biosynthesis
VAIIADYPEEGWPSMDLVADMLMAEFNDGGAGIDATLVRPVLPRRLSRISSARAAFTADRMTARLWDYPRLIRGISGRFDVYHVVDHSYSQLVHELPCGRTLVTCHDLDTFRSVLARGEESRSAPFRAMTRHILDGFRKAAHVACDTAATRDEVLGLARIPSERASVVHNGPHPACTPRPDAADAEAARLLGPGERWTDLLHVGSTIPRKRVEDLLRIVGAIPQRQPDIRLVRVGGAFTPAQESLARELGVTTIVLPFVDRRVLAAVYRRAALVLVPSEREGFGLPVLEALACGTPVVAIAPGRTGVGRGSLATPHLCRSRARG